MGIRCSRWLDEGQEAVSEGGMWRVEAARVRWLKSPTTGAGVLLCVSRALMASGAQMGPT